MRASPPETLDLSYDRVLLPRLELEFVHTDRAVGVQLWPWGRACCERDMIFICRAWLMNGGVNNSPGYWNAQLIWSGAAMVSRGSGAEFMATMRFAIELGDQLEKHAFEQGPAV